MTQVSMAGLGYVAIAPQWLTESDAFHHEDGRVVRAACLMLQSAWQSTPAGSIGSSFKSIARVCGLSEVEVGEHYEVLTAGWELRGERLCHLGMTDLCERLANRFGPVLEQMQLQSVIVSQAPEDFELSSPEPVSRRTKGRHRLPADFRISESMRQHMIREGFVTEEDQNWIFNLHRSWAESSGVMRNNWEASLENFVSKEPKRNIPSRINASASAIALNSRAPARPSRFGLAGQSSRDHNQSLMAAARSQEGRHG
ncbi:MAG TPA: hypothetical protein VN259_09055 [Xanthomonadales bacterium]|nr:hypothetical protein [Xanthomonadales bacterium]